MFTKKIFTLFTITLFAIMSATSEINAKETKTLQVDAKLKRVDTGFNIKKGDHVQVLSITGNIKIKHGGAGQTYEGNKNTVKSSNYFQFASAAGHSLVMWVGDTSNHRQVRKNIATEATTSGNLFFAINDGKDHYGDNSGEFVVTYKVIRKDKLCSPRTNKKGSA